MQFEYLKKFHFFSQVWANQIFSVCVSDVCVVTRQDS